MVSKIFITMFEFFMILRRKILLILSSSFLSMIIILSYTFAFSISEFSATGSFYINGAINAVIINTAKATVTSDNVMSSVVLLLKENDIHTIDNNEVNAGALRQRIFVETKSESPSIYVTFKCSSEQTAIFVVNSLILKSVSYGNENMNLLEEKLVVAETTNNAVYTGDSKLVLISSGLMFSFLFGVLIAYVQSCLSKKVYLVSNLEKKYNVNLINSTSKKNNLFKTQEGILKFHNKIDAIALDVNVNTIGFLPTMESSCVDVFLVNYAMTLARNDKKVIVVDLDFNNQSLSKKLLLNRPQNSLSENFHAEGLPSVSRIDDSFDLLSGGYCTFTSAFLKRSNFVLLIKKLKFEYDFVLVKNSSVQYDESYLSTYLDYDFTVVFVEIGKTTNESLSNLLSEVEIHNNQNMIFTILNV